MKESAKLIEQLLEEDEYNKDLASIREAQRLAAQFEEEYLLKKEEEEKNSRPIWSIWTELIDYEDMLPFNKWVHLFHRHCLSPYIEGKIKSK